MKKTLVVVDFQNDFVSKDGLLSLCKDDKCESLIKDMKVFLKKSISLGIFENIIFTYDTHFKEIYDKTSEAIDFPFHCDFESHGWKLPFDIDNPNSEPKSTIYKIYKHKFDMWNEELEKFESEDFRSMSRYLEYKNLNNIFSIDKNLGRVKDFYDSNLLDNEIYICGVASDVCVEHAMKGFLSRGNKVFILKDLTKGVFKEIDDVLANDFYKIFRDSGKLFTINSDEVN